MSEEEIQNRVEAIRRKRDKDAEGIKNKLYDDQIQWTAEVILEFENVNFINEINDDTNLTNYISNKLNNHKYDYLTSKFHKFDIGEKEYKFKYILDIIEAVKKTPEYIENELRRKKVNEEIRIRKQMTYEEWQLYKKINDAERIRRQEILDEEERKAIIEERINIENRLKEQQRILLEEERRVKYLHKLDIINRTNMNIKQFLTGNWTGDIVSHTFTDLTIDDWNVDKGFLVNTGDGTWHHYTINNSSMKCFASDTKYGRSVRPEFASSDYKVPFCIKCPTCNSPTKFSYLDKYHHGTGNMLTNSFRYVYCDNHYYYDSSKDIHYTANLSGKSITYKELNLPNTGMWHFQCWLPINNTWSIWDPSDPDGSKALAEKKKKEAEEIHRQILALQEKLAGLN